MKLVSPPSFHTHCLGKRLRGPRVDDYARCVGCGRTTVTKNSSRTKTFKKCPLGSGPGGRLCNVCASAVPDEVEASCKAWKNFLNPRETCTRCAKPCDTWAFCVSCSRPHCISCIVPETWTHFCEYGKVSILCLSCCPDHYRLVSASNPGFCFLCRKVHSPDSLPACQDPSGAQPRLVREILAGMSVSPSTVGLSPSVSQVSMTSILAQSLVESAGRASGAGPNLTNVPGPSTAPGTILSQSRNHPNNSAAPSPTQLPPPQSFNLSDFVRVLDPYVDEYQGSPQRPAPAPRQPHLAPSFKFASAAPSLPSNNQQPSPVLALNKTDPACLLASACEQAVSKGIAASLLPIARALEANALSLAAISKLLEQPRSSSSSSVSTCMTDTEKSTYVTEAAIEAAETQQRRVTPLMLADFDVAMARLVATIESSHQSSASGPAKFLDPKICAECKRPFNPTQPRHKVCQICFSSNKGRGQSKGNSRRR